MSGATKPALRAVPDAPAPSPEAPPDWEAVMPPIPWFMHVEDVAPDPACGQITGSRAGGYLGGATCPDCLTLVRFRGTFIGADQTPSGEYIELACRAVGRGSVGEIRGRWARWTCPRCRKYRQLALEVMSREPEFHALFVRREPGA